MLGSQNFASQGNLNFKTASAFHSHKQSSNAMDIPMSELSYSISDANTAMQASSALMPI